MPTGFSIKQRFAIEKALGYCDNMLDEGVIRGVKDLVNQNACTWTDCSLLCDSLFKVAYGSKGLFVSHEKQEQDREEAKLQINELLTAYNIL